MDRLQLPDGSVVPAQNVDFDVIDEPDLELETEEGAQLKARVVATSVHRVDAEDTPGGNEPIYSLNTEVHVRVLSVPDGLKTEPEDDDPPSRGVQ